MANTLQALTGLCAGDKEVIPHLLVWSCVMTGIPYSFWGTTNAYLFNLNLMRYVSHCMHGWLKGNHRI